MHRLGRTHNRIHRTRHDAQRAANATRRVNHRNVARLRHAAFSRNRRDRHARELRQQRHARIATRWAAVNTRLSRHNRSRIRRAALIAALRTLGLREGGEDGFVVQKGIL